MTKEQQQRFFSKAVRHLRKQKKRCINKETGGCAYRQDSTRSCAVKCAVGALIPNRLYSRRIDDYDDTAIEYIIKRFPNIKSYFKIENHKDIAFLSDLQDIHDIFTPREWEREFRNFAIDYSLEVPRA